MSFLLFLLLIAPAQARDLWVGAAPEDGGDESKLALASALKVTALGSAPSSGSALARLRLEPTYKTSGWTFDVAYDGNLSYNSATTLASAFAVPPYAQAPFRFWQIGGTFGDGNYAAQELDRAFVSYSSKNIDLTVGRQPIGWGHGKMFSAVDIFAPFTPLQVDQEWRRGIDAVRGDLKLSDTSSVELIAAAGQAWDQTAAGARVRGYFGPIDGELILAKRAQDTMYGVTGSGTLGGAEVHGELAFFATPGDVPSDGIFGNSALVPKAVLGISNMFQVGTGLTVSLEYQYSGFGAATAAGISSLLASPGFLSRQALGQGITQTLGTQVIGVLTSYTFSPQWSASLTLMQSLIDFSGVVAPSAVWDFSDNSSLLTSFFLSYAASSQNGVFQSQFGAVSPSVILQLRIYD